MSNAGFPINDLLRRKLQTTLTAATLTLSVASTLFLLFFSNRLGLGIASSKGTLTLGLTGIFSQFILFIGALIFIVGAVLTSFIVFLMMAQRTRDFGLIKAAGCPNNLVAGYFMTELLIVTFVGCVLGVFLGFLMDFAVSNVVFSGYQLPNFWFVPLVFIAFFALAIFFGLRPILKASRMSPIQALSPVNYYGLTVGPKLKPLSRSGLTWRIASRSLLRRQSASLRIMILLSIVFILLTVSVTGEIIDKDTTTSWIQTPLDSKIIAIAHISMENQYNLLLSKFSEAKETSDFNYSDPKIAIPEAVIQKLTSLPSVSVVDSRLIILERLYEISNFTIDPYTSATLPVGDSREGDAIVVGVNPQKLVGKWSIKGRFLSGNGELEAVVGDSVSQSMFYYHPSQFVVLSDPLVEGIRIKNTTFSIVGICVDPLNSGQVSYVPIDKLKNATGITNSNLILIKLNDSTDRDAGISQIKRIVQAADSDLQVFELGEAVDHNVIFLSSTWQTIMLSPLFTIASAAMCFVGYMMLAMDEQRQEFAILRAVGAKPRIIVAILAIQGAIVLISSFAIGISLGIIITLLILMTNPLITAFSVVNIATWLSVALIGMFIFSLYPAFRLAKASILKIMT